MFQNTYPRHFGPRLGMAYQVNSKTVARIGYGVNWMTLTGNSFMNGAIWNVGYGGLARLTQGGSPDGGLTFPLSFKTPMPNGAGYVPPTRDVTALNNSIMGNWFIAGADDMNPGYEHVVQLGIQHEVGSGPNSWVFEIAYNGNLGRELPFWHGKGEHIMPDAYHKIDLTMWPTSAASGQGARAAFRSATSAWGRARLRRCAAFRRARWR